MYTSSMKKDPAVDRYIAKFEGDVQQRLSQIRKIIFELRPDAEEGIMYGLVGYKLKSTPLIYFGGYKNHIGLYATPNTHEAFSKELAVYKQGKGSVQFPNRDPLPVGLIRRMAIFRVQTVRSL